MTNFNDDIPSVLNAAMQGETISQVDIDVDAIDEEGLLRDVDGNYGSKIPDRFEIPGDIEQRELDFRFKPGCATCAIAIDDPQVHEVYRQTKNAKEMERYIIEEYGDRMKPPSYKSITCHLNNHFLPEEKRRNADIIKSKAKIDHKSREISEWTRTHEASQLRAVAWVHLENISAIPKTAKNYLEAVKLFNPTAKTVKDLMELELKMLGVDGGTSPEEQEKKMKAWLTMLIGTMKEEDPEATKKLIGLLQKAHVPLK